MTSGGKAVRILHTINEEVLGIKISAKAGDVRVFPVNIANELIVQRLAQGFWPQVLLDRSTPESNADR